MSESATKHIIHEGLQGLQVEVQTTKEFPGKVFLHIRGCGFSFCEQFTEKQARHMGMAFLDAMDATAMDASEIAKQTAEQ